MKYLLERCVFGWCKECLYLVASFLCPGSAGHGGSVRDLSGDEEDSKDETMVPLDYAKKGQIKDDEILETVSRLSQRQAEGVYRRVRYSVQDNVSTHRSYQLLKTH